MEKPNRDYGFDKKIITEEMMELCKLAMKYSPSQLAAMATAIDLDNLQYEMGVNGATGEEFRISSECHHDIWEMMRECSVVPGWPE